GASALERGNDFIQFQNRLCMTDPVNDALLVGLINRANSTERHNPRGGSIQTARFDIELFPLKLNWWDADRSYAIVATKRPLLDALTAAEHRLASGLMQGQTLREYAQTSHISYETARTHLKRVMLKTATHSQAQLVSFLLSTDC
ncbi:MAG: helix-turn-helix transcriptional regulator, partial [Pseudomonadota bacterium]